MKTFRKLCLEVVSTIVAAEVTRRRRGVGWSFPPPHVGGYHRKAIRESLLGIIVALAGFVATSAGAQTNDAIFNETIEQRDARMAWFREARFGMFIHWGVYAVPAGEWDGKTNYGEWFLEETKMPVSQYEKYADQFNPVKFDAKEWVRMAKDAGMKYIVITSKHHDGFGLWDSQADGLGHRADALQARSAQGTGRRLQRSGHHLLLLSFHHGLASPGLGHAPRVA
jgi:hypothetical protein